jgi:hypothetical protein
MKRFIIIVLTRGALSPKGPTMHACTVVSPYEHANSVPLLPPSPALDRQPQHLPPPHARPSG